MWRLALAATAAATLVFDASAEISYAEGVARCAPIADEAARKACFAGLPARNADGQCDPSDFDAYLTCVQGAPPAAPTGAEGEVGPTASPPAKPRRATVKEAWEVAREAEASAPWHIETKTSAVTDTLDVIARITARDAIVGRYGDDSRPHLALVCRDDQTDVYFVMGGHWFYSSHPVTIRINNQDAKSYDWSASTNNQAAFHHAPIAFIKSLAGADQLLIKTAPIGESSFEAVFYLTGIDRVIKAIRTACSW